MRAGGGGPEDAKLFHLFNDSIASGCLDSLDALAVQGIARLYGCDSPAPLPASCTFRLADGALIESIDDLSEGDSVVITFPGEVKRIRVESESVESPSAKSTSSRLSAGSPSPAKNPFSLSLLPGGSGPLTTLPLPFAPLK